MSADDWIINSLDIFNTPTHTQGHEFIAYVSHTIQPTIRLSSDIISYNIENNELLLYGLSVFNNWHTQ